MRSIKFAAAVLAGLVTSSAAWAETVTVKYSNWLPANHFLWNGVYLPFFAEIEKVTEGRVKIEVLPKVVGTAASQFDVVRDALADMSFTVASYTSGRFPAAEVAELPLLGNNASYMAPAFFRHFKKHIEPTGEFNGVKVLSIFVHSPLQPMTAKRGIKTVADFQGQKIRTPNANTVMAMELMGAVPILKPSTEVFELLSTGAIDGQVSIPNVVPSFNQLDLLKYVTIVPGGLSNAVNMVFINPDKWAEIDTKDQAAIEAIAGEKFAATFGDAYMVEDAKALELMKQKGYEITIGSDALKAELAATLKPVEDRWISRAKEKGVKDPEGQLADFRAEIAKGEK